MPDPAHDGGMQQAADDEAHRPAGADEAKFDGGEALDRSADRQQQPMHPGGEEQEAPTTDRSAATGMSCEAMWP